MSVVAQQIQEEKKKYANEVFTGEQPNTPCNSCMRGKRCPDRGKKAGTCKEYYPSLELAHEKLKPFVLSLQAE